MLSDGQLDLNVDTLPLSLGCLQGVVLNMLAS